MDINPGKGGRQGKNEKARERRNGRKSIPKKKGRGEKGEGDKGERRMKTNKENKFPLCWGPEWGQRGSWQAAPCGWVWASRHLPSPSLGPEEVTGQQSHSAELQKPSARVAKKTLKETSSGFRNC